ncbi:MAG: hypothetical protein M3R27_15190 [Bacteroidota bacterium]|nr:hypothetical protein [Bacteroidota bacterium]
MAVYLVWLVNKKVISEDADKLGSEQQQWIFVAVSSILVVMSLLLIYMKRKKSASS